jgi:hypothetical protein
MTEADAKFWWELAECYERMACRQDKLAAVAKAEAAELRDKARQYRASLILGDAK